LRRHVTFPFNAGELDVIERSGRRLVFFVFANSFFFRVRNRLFSAAGGKWIGLGAAMTYSAEVDRSADTDITSAMVLVSMFLAVMLSAAALASSPTASAGRAFTWTARAAGGFCKPTSRKSSTRDHDND
jgi:hypothetical protein